MAFPQTLDSLSRVLNDLVSKNKINPLSYILFVDDGSKDNTWELIRTNSAQSNIVSGLKLSRNFGHQAALLAGLNEAMVSSDVSISIDADLQDDVSCIEKMIDSYMNGNEIVYGVRLRRNTDTWFKRNSANLFYKLMALMGVEQEANHADFRLMSTLALEAFTKLDERNLYIRGMIPLIGFRTDRVFYCRAERCAGETSYPLSKMISLAAKGITSATMFPLRGIFYIGLTTCLIAITLIFYTLIQNYLGNTLTGWTSLTLSILFFGGAQLLCLGVVGEYIGKIYTEVKRRPLFFIEEKLNLQINEKKIFQDN
ncbi:glycosyltransferase family 2 protein [Pantoea sp. SS70]|uniref:glycosyltransferase family 2 protein n=1 Tax=Pantoea sp. SS70 TaxID=3024247 RepID=UPI0024528852|nr:glycosyltransferase family 2 protein [Pantoea sp. SS70]WGK58687.1 glycosyltransferase family 2 protein [Pantoea sp. SS70]